MFINANESVKAVRDTMRRIRDSISDCKGDTVTAALQEVSVDRLSGSVPPQRIQLLKDSGICTIADIYKQGIASVKRINGIGPKTVAAIMDMSGRLRSEAAAGIPFELPEDPNAMTAVQRELVYRSCLYLEIRSNLIPLEQLIDANGVKRMEYASALSRATTSLGWLFSGVSQRGAENEAYAGMLTLLDGIVGQQLRMYSENIRGAFTTVTPEKAMARYIANTDLRNWILTEASSL